MGYNTSKNNRDPEKNDSSAELQPSVSSKHRIGQCCNVHLDSLSMYPCNLIQLNWLFFKVYYFLLNDHESASLLCLLHVLEHISPS